MGLFDAETVVRSWRWLAHLPGVTELAALHPAYRHGDRDWNRRHGAFPVVRYTQAAREVLSFVHQYAGSHLVCYGLNPRPSPLFDHRGRPRSAPTAAITMVQTVALDLDPQRTVTASWRRATWRFLDTLDHYFRDLGIARPVLASTGRGYHALYAIPPIALTDCPDVDERLRTFTQNVRAAHRTALDRLEVRLDSVYDRRRLIKVYGTAKPDVGIRSRFYGRRRRPDNGLREYLLGLPRVPPENAVLDAITVHEQLPDWFAHVLESDATIRDLWHGNGKPPTSDTSRSGYDYSLVRALAQRRHSDPRELATILAQRPGSHSQNARYITRTVIRALTGPTNRQQ